MDTVLALDVGGTKLAAGVVDADGACWPAPPVPRRRGADGELVLEALLGIAAEVRAGEEVAVRRRLRRSDDAGR